MTGVFEGKFTKDLPFPDDINEKSGSFGYDPEKVGSFDYDSEFEKGFSEPLNGEYGFDNEMHQESDSNSIYSKMSQEFQHPDGYSYAANAEPH